MTILTTNTNIFDLTFFSLVDLHSPNINKEEGKAFALSNWGELSEKAQNTYDHLFGKESRLHSEVVNVEETPGFLKKAIAVSEDLHQGFDQLQTGTL